MEPLEAQRLPTEQARLDCQIATLIVVKAETSAAELRTKDPVLMLLLLVHPTGNRQKQKAKRIQCLQHVSAA
jgi:hypothetical protein